MSIDAFVDAYLGLFRAAMDQSNPSEDLKTALSVARNSAVGLLPLQKRHVFVDELGRRESRAEQLARNLTEIYDDDAT